MASGLSVKLPLTKSPTFGAYNLNTTFKEVARQNLKMLLLTVPGERIMDPSFGVGIKKYLFEFNGAQTYSDISSRIHQQVARYMPYIAITDLKFSIPEGNPDLFPNSMALRISFNIIPLATAAALEIEVKN
jgi:phage baseplate assembly protein W